MKAKLLLGLLAYGGQVTTLYLRSLLELSEAARREGVQIELKVLDSESLISRGRNTMVAEFLGRPELTHLLFIDADIGFSAQTVLRLIAFDQPLTAAAYPMKSLNWSTVQKAAVKGEVPTAQLATAGLQFVLNLIDEDRTGQNVPVRNGFVRVSKAGTGMMLIRREVFAQMIERFPELRYRNDIAGYDNAYTRDNYWAFFDTLLHPQTRRYLSEDYAFCHRWTQGCGGEVWMDVQSALAHQGQYTYRGSYLDSIRLSGDERVRFKPDEAPAVG